MAAMLRHGVGAFQRALRRTVGTRTPARVAPLLGARLPTTTSPGLMAARSFSAGGGSEFLTGANNAFLEEMYEAWQQDRKSVPYSWDVYFRTGQTAHVPNSNSGVVTNVDFAPAGGGGGGAAAASDFRVLSLIRAYRSRGHEVAKLSPVGPAPTDELLALEGFGLSEQDLAMPLVNLSQMNLGEDARLLKEADNSANADGTTTLEELVSFLKRTYTGEASFEYMHVNDPEKARWLRERVERIQEVPSIEYRRKMVGHLAWADRFERFLAKRFNTAKRFGVEGLETLIPGLNAVLDTSAELGIQNVVLGMAHRGRLNVLTNVMRKPFELVFQEFHGILDKPEDWSGTGDVKYHLGTSGEYLHQESGNTVYLSLLPNPSHLEAVNTVVLGKVRAKMDAHGDEAGSTVLPILLHGDAAVAGQGIVYETMQLSGLTNYQTGGSLHIVTNNQVGFTTNPDDSRSTHHPSAIAKAFQAPVFHVNADNLFEVCRVFKIATEYRQEFRTDVVINLVGYRRYGHNELDQPSFTQPTLYSQIDAHDPVMDLTVEHLVATGQFERSELDALLSDVEKEIENSFDRAPEFVSPESPWMSGKWTGMKSPASPTKRQETGVPEERLDAIAKVLVDIPDDIKLHRQLQRIMKDKAKRLDAKTELDWGTVEALAFGSLLQDGINVRISGQDAQRGTFSHRHCVLHDQATDKQFTPLHHLEADGLFSAANSPLSEYGVLGYELGYSMEDPNRLTLWEAQFGDFTNGAQIIIDQFLSAMETKWYRQSGLVMLLPHGYQGLGPEHSSCRIERFLQCSSEHPDEIMSPDEQLQRCNWQIANPTTPANYFHLLRRQIYREFRKPLIVASPKNLLRHKQAHSSFADLVDGTKFHRVLPEAHPEELKAPSDVKRVIFCSGKLYYELLDERREQKRDDVAIVRLEQLSPFPSDLVAEELAQYENAEVVWAQEEPMNMGAWQHVEPRIHTAGKRINGTSVRARYVGRRPMAATAEGTSDDHNTAQAALIAEALE